MVSFLLRNYFCSNYNCYPLKLYSHLHHFNLFKFHSWFSNIHIGLFLRKCTQISINNSEILRNRALENYVDKIKREYDEYLMTGSAALQTNTDPKQLSKIANLINCFHSSLNDIRALNELRTSTAKDEDFISSLNEELMLHEKKLNDIEKELITELLPTTENESTNDIVLEIDNGVGGQEAMLFAQQLFNMYDNFVTHNDWRREITDLELSDIGGLKYGTMLISGSNSYKLLHLEAGVHRVQRIPKTENTGRIHTSTVSVAVYPQLSEVDVVIDNKDLKVETKNASAPGGQHVNKTQSAIRIHHIPSGLIVECENERSQYLNRKTAMQKLRLRLYKIASEKRTSKIKGVKKEQIGTKSRNEKIRTYNFPQDRVTDHRYNKSTNNLCKLFEGGSYFANYLSQLLEIHNDRKKKEFLKSLPQTNE